LLFLGLAISIAAAPAVSSTKEEVLTLDHSFANSLNKADQSGVLKVLDPEFTWTNRTGKTESKQEFLSSLASLATGEDAEMQVMEAGSVVLLHGSHHLPSQNVNVRFVRVWVRHPAAWQLLVYQETNKADKNPEKRAGFGAPSNGEPVNCENPCKTIPYKPETPAEQEVASMWQAVERTVLTNDVEAWIPNFTDDFLFVTPDGGTPLNKEDRVVMIKELKRTNTTLIPAEVLTMKVWVFGDAAVMRSEHKPHHGKILHVTRLFEKHNGHWQIAFGQQTWVE
jgi:ketosteroid isomerase-like protein